MLGDACGGGDRSVCHGGVFVCSADGSAVVCTTMAENGSALDVYTLDLSGTEKECNGIDDDCNGIIDDGVANCACTGKNETEVSLLINSQEICNGIDDNCNNATDDNVPRCGCVDGNHSAGGYEPQICNGIDDDCNGIIDDGVANCACAAGTTLATVEGNISEEICNGIDDDCNGGIDDQFPMLGDACGGYPASACYGGALVCAADGVGVVCSTMTPPDGSYDGRSVDRRSEETCNGIDDDCNDRIDDFDKSEQLCACYEGRHSFGEIPETCNGIDDDCDGLIDSGLENCGCSDIFVSGNNAEVVYSVIASKKSSTEICNNIDDNCNGEIDEGLEDTCFCAGGYSGIAAGRPEFCNGIDDDCNGIIDDVANPSMCACYDGQHKPGELEETCNGIDDDCNGLIDEKWPEKGAGCGVGVCAGGMYECSNDYSGTVCSTESKKIESTNEKGYCDEFDNNCNSAVDEGCDIDVDSMFGNEPPPPVINRTCGMDIGECSYGLQIGIGGRWGPCLSVGDYKFVGPAIELCNGKDDDCDGIVDNIGGMSSVDSTRCGCFDGRSPSPEICNGIDDDCDGIVDNVNGKTSVKETKCGCYDDEFAKGAGVEICNGIDDDCDGIVDNVKDEKSVESTRCGCFDGRSPSPEICNGIDDNCNGDVDEGFDEIGKPCGTGACSGTYICSDDGSMVVCDGNSPETETCNGIDDDCDGKVDEGCYGNGLTSCENGIKDGTETGIDCGGSCPNVCSAANMHPEQEASEAEKMQNTWFIVFVVMAVLIIGIGLVLQFGLKRKEPSSYTQNERYNE